MKLSDMFVDEMDTVKNVMKIIDDSDKKLVFVTKDSNKLVGVVNDGDIRRALLSGADVNDPIHKIANTSPIIDVETAIERIKLTNATNIIIPVLDDEKRIIDTKVITKDGYEIDQNENRILVIGGAGYLGSVLCRKLLDRGYKVRVLDNLMYGEMGIKDLIVVEKFEFIHGDMRNIETLVRAVDSVDAVIHLAAIVGDPACELDPKKTIEINYLSSKLVAEVCKFCQINRLIFASTCSVYGANKDSDQLLNEKSETNPLSLYAKMKLRSEEAILDISDNNFKPTIFRMATLHGVSSRMRFDLVVNLLTAKAIEDKSFTIFGGDQWRAFCHVDDAADAYIRCLETPLSQVGSEIFNIVRENLRIRDVKSIVEESFDDITVNVEDIEDMRDYKVSGSWAQSTMNLSFNKFIQDTIDDIKVTKESFGSYKNSLYSNVENLRV